MLLPRIAADVDTALLDVDGTLVDSNGAHAQAWVAAFHEHGFTIAFDRVRPLIGMGADHLLPAAVPGLSDERDPGKAIAARRGEIFKQRYLRALQPTRGARELLERLRAGGVRCVAATSAKEDELDGLLAQAGVADLITAKSTADDAPSSKPAPDIVHAALTKAGARAERSFLLGDTRYDVAAAGRAGVPAIALRCGGANETDLRDAAAVYDDPLSLLAAIRIS